MSHFASPETGLTGQILDQIRIPRTLAAFSVGSLLAMSGVAMQVLLRNPLADPYILGVSGGAAVGALSAILLGASSFLLVSLAFAGALGSTLIVFGISNPFNNQSMTRLLLTGVVVSAGWGAVINLILTTSTSNTVQSMLFWLMGDLSQSTVSLGHFILIVIGLVGGIGIAKSLNVLSRGDLVAVSLGVNVNLLRIFLYFSASIFTAVAVTIGGSVGFVGLVTPHILRMLGARDHRVLIPASVMLGGSIVLIADTLARTILAPQQLPVGIFTAIIGVPCFLFIMNSSGKKFS
tara:strand:- start:194 stop:1069 length:876 start_codon:yes stop_codon:yes gene_type:complete